MAFMKDYAAALDATASSRTGLKYTGPGSPSKWLTEDFTFIDPTGKAVSGVEPAWAAVMQVYGPMSSQYHEPRYGIIWETDDGYELFGVAWLYYNLHAPPRPQGGPEGGSATKIKDESEGNEWEMAGPSANHFRYRRDKGGHQGLKICEQRVYADSFPMKAELVKRGVVTLEQLS